jgi:hypothetical protein
MLQCQRESLISEILWNGQEDLSYYVDCCKYSGIDEFKEGVNWRAGRISNKDGNEEIPGHARERIGQWLRQEISGAQAKSNESRLIFFTLFGVECKRSFLFRGTMESSIKDIEGGQIYSALVIRPQ